MTSRSNTVRGRVPLVVLGLWVAAACATKTETDVEPRKIAVQASSTGSLDEAATAGLVREITHWLQYDPALIVRSPSRRLRPITHEVEAGDVDDVLWVQVASDADGVSVRWDLVDANAHRPPTFSAHDPVGGELPRLPGAVAKALAVELGVGVGGEGVEGHAVATDPGAYADFLRVIGNPPTAEDERAALRAEIELLEELSARLPRYPAAAYALGSAYLDLAGLVGGRGPWYGRAEGELLRAFELDPGDPPIRAKLASFFAKVGRSEESVELLVEGLADHPSFPAFHQQLGYVLRYAGLMEQSMASYRRSQELDSSSGNLISAQDQITKSLIYLGDYEGALASHRRMKAFAEQAGHAINEKQWFYEGVIHLYRGDDEAALHAFRSGARLDPVSVWTTFGTAYEAMALGDTKAVEAVLSDLESRDVVDGERHYRLVHFSAFTRDVDRAVDHLRRSTDGGFFNAPYVSSDPWTAVLRGQPEVEEMIDVARARGDRIRSILQE
jgi:tetratricopeptide (TPR) repeat protein